MDRRHFLTACGAGLGALGAVLTARENGPAQGSPTGTPNESTPTRTPDEGTPTRTPVPPLAGTWRSYQHDAATTGATGDTGPTAEPAVRWGGSRPRRRAWPPSR